MLLATILVASGCYERGGGIDLPKFPRVRWVLYEDVNANRLVDSPDTLTIKFSMKVQVTSGVPAGSALVVWGGASDTLGSSTFADVGSAKEVGVLLASDASLQPTGTYGFDPQATGLDLLVGQGIITFGDKGKPSPARGTPVDIGGDLHSRVTDAVYEDANLNLVIDAGDVIRVEFFPPIDVGTSATLDGAFQLPVAGDTFGIGADLVSPGGTNLVEMEILLGTNPVLQLNGTFDSGNLTPGAPSGIDVTGSLEITQTIGGAAVEPLTPAGADIR